MKLHLSDDLELPINAVTQTFAFLARRGAGKTYAASKLCEEMLKANAQVVVLDPVGNWYGLRLGADGKSKGLSIPVFGGLRGDIPLEPGAGALVADLVVDRGISVVLDVSMFRKGERKRFATDFAEQLFHRKKSSRSAIHLFVEEAQVFVPQRAIGDEARMLGAFEDLVKLGRNFGVGVTLISQRPQSVNKDALNQTEALFVLQTNGSQERKALRDWIVDQGLSVDLIDELPKLPIGTAYVWSPQWLKILKKVHISKKKTFNASATPEVGEKKHEARELAPVDLEQIQTAMKDTIERAKVDDPKALRKRIAELEADLRKRQQPAPAKVERIEVNTGLDPRLANKIEMYAKHILAELQTSKGARTTSNKTLIMRDGPPRLIERGGGPVRPQPTRQQNTGPMGIGEVAVLTAIAQHPQGVLPDQLSVLTGYKRSTRNTYLQRLGAAGFIERRGETILATSSGTAELGSNFSPLPTGDALRKHWIQRLPEGERRIFEVVVAAYPHPVPRETIGEETGYTRSSRNTYLQRLGARRLIENRGPEVFASETLFGGASP